MAGLTGPEWTGLLQAARESELLGTLWRLAGEAGVQERLPEPAARHLWGGYLAAERNAEAVRWELEQLDGGLLGRLSPPVALKGAAYLLAGLPNAAGRVCHDIDLLFPADEVGRAESLLFFEGWQASPHDAHDQRYYRQWMHELPPLVHRRRGATLDLHHNLLPETFAVRVEPRRVLDAAAPLAAPWRLRVPAPEHLALHAAVHLFAETEWQRGLRDLYDIHALVEHFQAARGDRFWEELLDEAEALGVAWLVEPALACGRTLLGTRVPAAAAERLERHGPPRWRRGPMRALFRHGLNTRASRTPRRDALARAALLLRGHWLKMPPTLLARHLLYKAFRAPQGARAGGGETPTHRHG
ncbi:nucleotidyltransferase family protein [Halorhodospira neutriphila]|uniref:Nucleotidyltransferase family protein n=1 Tax=Halorhodospira neutriphila TaxID=168379 RepID=A0ABS1E7I6_9GAMM|nr:nucleotidyltransferase family protein [Halorhodospira neutriphila]MBK1727478.1 hypothetical protein [Halorhodospira neutriphila]